MGKINLDKILDVVNNEKIKKGLNDYIPSYPMLRIEKNKLYIVVLLFKLDDKVWTINSNVKADYWFLIDIDSLNILEFNETTNKDYLNNILDNQDNIINNNQKEISMYEIKKIEEYTNYLLNDIKNNDLPIQKQLSSLINNVIEIDGEQVNINDYIMANIEDDIKPKIKELVNIIISSKYSTITYYYDILFNKIIDEYKSSNNINNELLNNCINIMINYYPGVLNIKNIFNI